MAFKPSAPKVNDKCLKQKCKKYGKKIKLNEYRDKYMTSKNLDFTEKNHKMAELANKTKKGKCQECACNLMAKYANYAGVLDSDGICVPDYEAWPGCQNHDDLIQKPHGKEGKIANYEGEKCTLR